MEQSVAIFVGNDDFSRRAVAELRKSRPVAPFSFAPVEGIPGETQVVAPGDLPAFLGFVRRKNVTSVVFAGRIDPTLPFSVAAHPVAKLLLGGLRQLRGEDILGRVAGLLEKNGLKVLPLPEVFPNWLASEDRYTRAAPSKAELADVAVGLEAAACLVRFRIGQALAVKNGLVLAAEAAEGTDRMIARVGELGERCRGFVLVKIAGENKDPRFDLPTVGPATVEALYRAGGRLLAVEKNRSLLVAREETVALCEQHNIGLITCTPGTGP